MRQLLIAAMSVSLLISGCEQDGEFFFVFDWGELPPPEPGTVDVYGTLFAADRRLEANGGAARPYRPGVELDFVEVPFGKGLVVQVRMFDAGEPDEGVPRYLGRTAPFDFARGDNIRVRVPFSLRLGPRLRSSDPSRPALRVLNATAGQVRTSLLTLEVAAQGAETLQVAQDLDFAVGLRSFATRELEASLNPGGGVTYRLEYDLNATREDCQPNEAGQVPLTCDGPRQVLVRAVDGAAMSSPLEARVTLDTTPPEIALASRIYLAEPNNPLGQVRAATDGTTLLVTLTFNEVLDAVASPPRLTAGHGSSTMDFVLLDDPATLRTSATFSVVIDRSVHADGVYTPTVTLQDIAGNRNSTASFAGPDVELRVDTTPDILTIRQSQVSFIRSPIGNASPEDLLDASDDRAYTVPGGVAFFELGPPDGLSAVSTLPRNTFELTGSVTPALIRMWADADKQILLGSASPPTSNGDWPRNDLQLVNLDTARVYVTGLDDAGNESAPRPIENAWFVGSTAEAPAGASPHIRSFSGRALPPLADRVPPTLTSSLSSPDGQAEVAHAARAWELRSGESPVARNSHAMAYDSARGRVVLFGGKVNQQVSPNVDNNFSDTWEWDGRQWLDVTPNRASRPDSRLWHAMAYDSRRGRIVMFGGTVNGFDPRDDTWEWDGNQWRDVTPSTDDNPPPRRGHALVYDSMRDRVVLFGGRGKDGGLDDTWEWDGSQWRDVTPSTEIKPSARYDFGLAYDSVRARVVLFGGTRDGSTPLSDTWEWDGSQWLNMNPVGPPPPRLSHALAYDRRRERVVMYGGRSATAQSYRETWLWDGSQWERGGDEGASGRPNEVREFAMAYDGARARVVYFGGLADTWEWDGSAWFNVSPLTESPPKRRDYVLRYDEGGAEVVVFGGQVQRPPGGQVRLSDTWTWNGNRWRNRTTTNGVTPSEQHRYALAYDGGRRRLVLFGNRADANHPTSTWEWTGFEWLDATPSSNRPQMRSRPHMVFDSARQRVLLFGGRATSGHLDGTWTWDGTQWQSGPLNGQDPAPGQSSLAYDLSRDRVVLFAGKVTWEWEGTRWDQVIPAGPSPFRGGALTYDSARAKVVLFSVNGETWEWDGSRWQDVGPSSMNPPARSQHAIAYDSRRERVVLFGGFGADEFADTWEALPPDRPDAQFALQLPSDIPAEALRDLRVRAFCGGTYQDSSGTEATGAQLLGWVTGGPGKPPGRFETLDTTPDGLPLSADSTGRMNYRPEPPASASDITQNFVGPDRRMYFHCRPSGSSGTGLARVGLDYMEVRVRYTTTDLQ